MEKHIYNEYTGISYTLQGDYYLPDLALPEQEDKPIGLWGQLHLRYIKQHRKVRYTNLLTSGKLHGYLADIDKQTEDMFFRFVKQMAECEGVTEKLKADNQIEWVARMNNIRNRATEIVIHNIIYNYPRMAAGRFASLCRYCRFRNFNINDIDIVRTKEYNYIIKSA